MVEFWPKLFSTFELVTIHIFIIFQEVSSENRVSLLLILKISKNLKAHVTKFVTMEFCMIRSGGKQGTTHGVGRGGLHACMKKCTVIVVKHSVSFPWGHPSASITHCLVTASPATSASRADSPQCRAKPLILCHTYLPSVCLMNTKNIEETTLFLRLINVS